MALLVFNLLISLYALYVDTSILVDWSFKPEAILDRGQWYRMVTAGFLHASLLHLGFNMVVLFSFGFSLEAVLGTGPFCLVYFGSMLVGHLIPLYKYRDHAGYVAVGASGALSGIVFGFALFFPLDKIFIFPIPFGIPALLFAIGFMVFTIYASRGRKPGGGVAHEAHLGGALGGLILTFLVKPDVVYFIINELNRALEASQGLF